MVFLAGRNLVGSKGIRVAVNIFVVNEVVAG